MTLIPVLQVDLFWIEDNSDGKNCNSCELPIEGKMWHPVSQFAEKEIKETTFTDIQIRLCSPCFKKQI